MSKPYFITVTSQKGGVGKTVVSVNLACALSNASKKVLLVDADFSNPSIGMHLKFEDVNKGILDVMRKKVTLDDAVVKYFPATLSVLPGAITEAEIDEAPTAEEVARIGKPLQASNYDFVIFDTSPGIVSKSVLEYYYEALLITTPDLPSLTSSIRLSNLYKKNNIRTNFIVNRLTGEKHEITVNEIEEEMEKKALAVLPEDPAVSQSISKQLPLFLADEDSPFSLGIEKLKTYYVHHSSSMI
jgi:septum site-determining protein MinD